MATKARDLALAASNVDSAGNIKADTLDNIDSLGFIRSDADDVVTGDITFSDIVVNDTATFNKYIKLPSYTTSERNSITAVAGMLVYNSDAGVLQQFVGDGVWASIAPSAAITSVTLPSSQTAAAEGDTITISGVGFDTNANVSFILSGNETNSASTTRIDSTQLQAVLPSLSEGTYIVRVTNGTGVTTDLANAVIVDGKPIFNTATGSLGTLIDNVDSANFNVGATEDGATLNVSISSGALPSGLSISSTGSITGTVSANVSADTQFNFTISATDAENQVNTRNYSITVLENYVQSGSTTF